MKHLILALLFSISASANHQNLPHLDLEMSGEELARYLPEIHALDGSSTELDYIIAVGKRNLDWLKHINSFRGENKLSFSSATTQSGISIESPKIYNPTIIQKDYFSLVAELPKEFKEVLIEGKDFTNSPLIKDEEYVEWGRKVDKSYQSAARWLSMKNFLPALAARAYQDVRGYYFLSKETDLVNKLNRWQTLDTSQQEFYKTNLVLMCTNSRSEKDICRKRLQRAINSNKVANFYADYFVNSQQLWNSFFKLEVKRDDLKWTDTLATLPFVDPENEEIKNFLSANIQNEWQWKNWKLLMDFKPKSSAKAFVTFVPGATPNVNGLGGNRITMDANQPLSEYNVQWTIRHEFGHVLGFQDCYIEFYDIEEKAIINYQLDTTNIMCSRKGRLLETHYQEMKKTYTDKKW